MNDISKIAGDIQQSMPEPSKAGSKGGASFETALKDALKEASDVQNNAEKAIEDFAKGDVKDIHTVIIAMEEADMHMQTLLQVRNKLLTAYNTIMGMQV